MPRRRRCQISAVGGAAPRPLSNEGARTCDPRRAPDRNLRPVHRGRATTRGLARSGWETGLARPPSISLCSEVNRIKLGFFSSAPP